MWLAPITPSISAFGTNAATESITIISIAPDKINFSAMSRACSPLSGWDKKNLPGVKSTPRALAYSISSAFSASINAAIPPVYWTSAIACNAIVVLPEDSGP